MFPLLQFVSQNHHYNKNSKNHERSNICEAKPSCTVKHNVLLKRKPQKIKKFNTSKHLPDKATTEKHIDNQK